MLYGLFNQALDWERKKYFIRLTLSAFCFRFWGKQGWQLCLIGILFLLLSLVY